MLLMDGNNQSRLEWCHFGHSINVEQLVTTPIFKDPPPPIDLSYEDLLGDNIDLFIRNRELVTQKEKLTALLEDVLKSDLPELRRSLEIATVTDSHQLLDLMTVKVKHALLE